MMRKPPCLARHPETHERCSLAHGHGPWHAYVPRDGSDVIFWPRTSTDYDLPCPATLDTCYNLARSLSAFALAAGFPDFARALDDALDRHQHGEPLDEPAPPEGDHV